MRRAIALFALGMAASSASAQVTLSTVQGGVTTPVGQLFSFGSVALGNITTVDFRLTNTGTSAEYLSCLSLSLVCASGVQSPPSAYFSIDCPLSPDLCGGGASQELPIQINPTGTLDFTVQFEPLQLGSPGGFLSLCAAAVCDGNTISVILTGTGVAGLSALIDNQPLGAGELISFGAVPVGSSQTIAVMLTNQTPAPLTVPSIPALTGGPFTLSGSALNSPTVAPNESAELDVIFTPTAAGAQQATLAIGLFTYSLQGTGVAPPPPVFPTPSILLTLATPASAQQGAISVNLAQASAAAGSGTVTLTFQSAVSGVTDDPTITFADGSRSATFTVAVGASEGQFANGPSLAFGTGTTAGTVSFTVTLGASTAQASATIPSAKVGIDAAVAVRNTSCDPSLAYCTGTNVQVQVNGWDNTRTASEITFTFTDASGNLIAPGPIAVSAASAFQSYFAASDLGGVFGVTAFFPITGDSDTVVSAVVSITNSAGTIQTAQITF